MASILCHIGIHRWEYRTEYADYGITDWARCKRPDCPFYADEMVVNFETLTPRAQEQEQEAAAA